MGEAENGATTHRSNVGLDEAQARAISEAKNAILDEPGVPAVDFDVNIVDYLLREGCARLVDGRLYWYNHPTCR